MTNMFKYQCLFSIISITNKSYFMLDAWYLDPLEVHGVHDGALEEGDGGEVPLDQALQLQAGRGPDHSGECGVSKRCY